MTRAARGGDGAGGSSSRSLEPPALALLDEPLEYFLAEHARQRIVAAMLREAAGRNHIRSDAAASLVVFLERDLPLHHEDEDVDFFPRLRERAVPEDGLTPILEQLSHDHRFSAQCASAIVAALSASPIGDQIPISTETAGDLNAFSEHELHHLSVENGIVIVIARKRLKPADLNEISLSMKSRRGMAS